jgi:hypothetical protein
LEFLWQSNGNHCCYCFTYWHRKVHQEEVRPSCLR